MLLGGCKEVRNNEDQQSQKKIVYDLLEIKAAGELRALVDNSSTSYFIYKGAPMGYEYELLSKFAEAIEVDLRIILIKNLDNITDSLNSFHGDVIAANLTVTKNRAEQIEFSHPLLQSKQVLVQRSASEKDVLVKSPTELQEKEIYVRKNSSFYNRILHLSDEIGGGIIPKTVAGNVTVEELIKKVSNGEIDYTVADEHVAKINKAFYRNININTPISLEQDIAWAVRKGSPDLLIAMNLWLNEFKKTLAFRVIYLKYFGNTRLYRTRVNSDLFTSKSKTISPYDDLIREESKKINWDWKLLSALIYQESRFDHKATSWAGAQGLMQLMPNTAAKYGIDSSSSIGSNINAGVRYLAWLDKQFIKKIEDQEERKKFVLAAYNVGLGHVFDAIRLAEKYDKNPKVWFDNVAEMMLNKVEPRYYKDDVVYYGYCRGSEPFKYVKEILNRFEHYRNAFDDKLES